MTTPFTNARKTFQKAALSGLVALLPLLTASAQQQTVKAPPAQPTAARPAVAEEQEPAATPQKPGQEGLRVHGHWSFDLKDKDGKVIEHRDLENSLQVVYGSQSLAQLLTGTQTVSNFVLAATQNVAFDDNPYDNSAPAFAYLLYPSDSVNTIAADGFCQFQANGNNRPTYSYYCVPGLTETTAFQAATCAPGNAYPSSGYTAGVNCGQPTAIVLQGSIVPTAAITIDTVFTELITCASTSLTLSMSPVSPSACRSTRVGGASGGNAFGFTNTRVSPVIPVATGQTLAITVTLSFS